MVVPFGKEKNNPVSKTSYLNLLELLNYITEAQNNLLLRDTLLFL